LAFPLNFWVHGHGEEEGCHCGDGLPEQAIVSPIFNTRRGIKILTVSAPPE
jgi:hypothetical protein